MVATLTISTDGIENLDLMLAAFPDVTKQALAYAINHTAKRDAARMIRSDMLEQVNLKKSYLIANTPVRAYATPNDLKATIKGRDTPTMLGRFALNRNPKNLGRQKGVRVRVKPSSTKNMKTAWIAKLRNDNIAVMLRTKDGSEPYGITGGGGRYVSKLDAWILYAPSIDQMMWGVANKNIPKIQIALRKEFMRQFSRLKGR